MAEENIMDALISCCLTVETHVCHTMEKAITAPGTYQTMTAGERQQGFFLSCGDSTCSATHASGHQCPNQLG